MIVRSITLGAHWAAFSTGLFTGHGPARGSDQAVLQKKARVEPARVGRCSKYHGSGRVVSGQEVFKSHGAGRVTLTRSDPRNAV